MAMRRYQQLRLTALFALPLLAAIPAGAEESPATSYKSCVAQIDQAPEAALADATAWAETGGGAAARHCAALAQVALGQYEAAAGALESLAGELGESSTDTAIRLLGQAGNAWLLADKPEAALAVLDRGLAAAPGDVEMLIDRARAKAARGDYWAAIDDLNGALDTAPERDDALVFRAAAYRRLGTNELAADDLARALALNPDNPDGLLERGALSLAFNRIKPARADFSRVLLVAPDTPAAELARAFLAELDRD